MPDFFVQSDGTHELGPVAVMQEEPELDRSPSPDPGVIIFLVHILAFLTVSSLPLFRI